MKHMLMDPAFPDLVAAAAADEQERKLKRRVVPEPVPEDAVDAFLTVLGKLEMASTRLW